VQSEDVDQKELQFKQDADVDTSEHVKEDADQNVFQDVHVKLVQSEDADTEETEEQEDVLENT